MPPDKQISFDLPSNEAQQLAECEATIQQGLQTFYEVGNALLAIRDGRLYRQEYATFEDYCQEKWDISRPRAYQLIGASDVMQTLSTMVDKEEDNETEPTEDTYPLPTSERQARPLTSLPPPQQREAWQHAVDTAPDGKVTASHVKDVVSAYKEAKRSEPAKAKSEYSQWKREAGFTDIPNEALVNKEVLTKYLWQNTPESTELKAKIKGAFSPIDILIRDMIRASAVGKLSPEAYLFFVGKIKDNAQAIVKQMETLENEEN